MVHGANIRLSTMDLSILSRNKVSLMTLDEKYLPTAIVLPFEGHARQSKLMHAQVSKCSDIYLALWVQIINRKVRSLKRIILDDSDEKLILPIVLPIESMEGITE